MKLLPHCEVTQGLLELRDEIKGWIYRMFGGECQVFDLLAWYYF
jgi:hypothetical protein